MLGVFTDFASWLTYSILGLSPETKLADATHFFVEDVSKIFVLLIFMIYVIALMRASLNIETVRSYLARKHRGIGYRRMSTLAVVIDGLLVHLGPFLLIKYDFSFY